MNVTLSPMSAAQVPRHPPARTDARPAGDGDDDHPGPADLDDPLLEPGLADALEGNWGAAEDAEDAEGAGPPAAAAAPASAQAARRAGLVPVASEAQLRDWLSAVADHDEQALAALYDATLPRVYGLVLRLVRQAALAEEVTEDTFFQVWRQAARYDPARGQALAWLLGMARSRAIDALRREARFRHEPLDEGDDARPWPAEAASGDELLGATRSHAALHQALLRLPPQPRQLVALSFFRGLSHEEIAQQTQLPMGTVKSQIRRALLSLRDMLGEAAGPSPAQPPLAA